MAGKPPVWEVGDKLQETVLEPVSRLGLIKYAGASGDYNPIHTIDDAAERAGLPGVIAHGMLTMATMSLPFSYYLVHGYVKGFRSRFSGMVYLGDVLRVGGRVTGTEEVGEDTLYTFEVYARKGEETVASGAIDFLVYEDSKETV